MYLVQCCREHNPAAQRALYNRHVDSMMLLCLRYIPNQEDAKEALMDGFLGFFKHIGGFTWQGQGSVRAWLSKIVVNQCLAQLRKRQPFFVQRREGEQPEPADPDDDVLGHLTAREIIAMVQRLPAGYRGVFNLYVFEGMAHREIGTLLDISESTSKSQLHRARAMLKDQLLKEAKIKY